MTGRWDIDVTFVVEADNEDDAMDRVREAIGGDLEYFGPTVMRESER